MNEPRLSELKLTQEQFDRVPVAESGPSWAAGSIGAFFGTPIRIVDSYWESTIGEKQIADIIEGLGPYRPPPDQVRVTYERAHDVTLLDPNASSEPPTPEQLAAIEEALGAPTSATANPNRKDST